MKKVNYEPYTKLEWILVECPYCDYQHTLFADDRRISSKDLELPKGDKVLCNLNELDDIHVAKILKCDGCKKKFEIEGAFDD